MIRRWLAAPALHFLVAGGALLGAERWLSPAPAIGIETAGASDAELLYREALALGVDRRDAAVQGRLARLATFVGEDAADEVAAARRLGLAQSDLVVRRHLVQVMELAAAHPLAADAPDDAALAAYRNTHAAELTVPERWRFHHVFLSRERHGTDLADDATALLARLQAEPATPAAAAERGDPFLGGAALGPATATDVDRVLGAGFAARLAALPVGTWSGPLPSPYGVHLVWVDAHVPAYTPSVDDVRSRLVHRVLHERGAERARARLAELRIRAAR